MLRTTVILSFILLCFLFVHHFSNEKISKVNYSKEIIVDIDTIPSNSTVLPSQSIFRYKTSKGVYFTLSSRKYNIGDQINITNITYYDK